jgi:hypothetical protein
MLHSIYKCDDYDFNDGVLIIYNAELVAQIKNITDWDTVSSHVGMYDAMICPSMYKDEKGNTADIVIFKQL